MHVCVVLYTTCAHYNAHHDTTITCVDTIYSVYVLENTALYNYRTPYIALLTILQQAIWGNLLTYSPLSCYYVYIQTERAYT
jgi:hypothetical protein